MKITNYKHDDWIVYFSGGRWAPLGFSHWISLYTRKPFTDKIDYFVNQTIMVWDGKVTTCYIRESEREIFGKKIVEIVKKNPKYINTICDGFCKGTDHILSIYKSKKITYKKYKDYIDYFLDNYYIYHLQVKNVIDFLPKKLLKTYLPKLEAARIHAEPLFSQEVNYIKKISKHISKKSSYQPEHISFSFYNELISYWYDEKKLPTEKKLKERRQGCVILFENGGIQDVLVGSEISKFSTIFSKNNNTNTLKGNTAFKGKTQGTVRVIFDPSSVKEFNNSDILVAPWTRPEYLPIMKKAGAFVTDGGGMLSHAAIVARELKKPCVIATKNATQILKDGDKVEVDANKGIVKILK